MPAANPNPQDADAAQSNAEMVSYEREQLRALRPSPVPTDAQLATVGRLMRGRPDQNVSIVREPFDLPTGYIVLTFTDGFTVGISLTGEGSS